MNQMESKRFLVLIQHLNSTNKIQTAVKKVTDGVPKFMRRVPTEETIHDYPTNNYSIYLKIDNYWNVLKTDYSLEPVNKGFHLMLNELK